MRFVLSDNFRFILNMNSNRGNARYIVGTSLKAFFLSIMYILLTQQDKIASYFLVRSFSTQLPLRTAR